MASRLKSPSEYIIFVKGEKVGPEEPMETPLKAPTPFF